MHDDHVLGVDHSTRNFEEPPFNSNSHMLSQVCNEVQDLKNRMQGMEDMLGCVQGIEENLSNLTLDINRQMQKVNFNVNLILHKLED